MYKETSMYGILYKVNKGVLKLLTINSVFDK
jgi:hypothetical protein